MMKRAFFLILFVPSEGRGAEGGVDRHSQNSLQRAGWTGTARIACRGKGDTARTACRERGDSQNSLQRNG